jgi:hypothetical protein
MGSGNFDQVTKAYEEAFEHHILEEFEKLVFKIGAGEVLKRMGEETSMAIYDSLIYGETKPNER